MLNVAFFTFNVFEENTYLIANEKKECWIVDPGMYAEEEVNQLIGYLNEKDLKPQAIINTHAHIDHIFGVDALKAHYKIPFGIHEQELSVLNFAESSAAMFGFDFAKAPKADFFIRDNTPLQLGDDVVNVLFTPGHSVGSISFYYPKSNWVISGDVLFERGIGRTDLPGGNFDTLVSSIRTQLFTLPAETTVLPGHGSATRIGEEKKSNPFLQ